jgi:putative salt-induced outer membrane protein
MGKGRACTCLTAILVATGVEADEPTAPRWGGEGELGYTRTTGNTDTESLVARLGVKHERQAWRSSLKLEGVNKSDQGVSVAERYYAAAQTDYRLTKKGYLFVRGDYEDDRFSGYDYRANVAAGYGHRLIDAESFVLNAEIGPGARATCLNDGDSETVATGRLAGDLRWKLSEYARFTTETSAVSGGGTTDYRSLSALTAKLNSYLSLRVSYLYKHSTDAPIDRARTDTETAVTLVYGF